MSYDSWTVSAYLLTVLLVLWVLPPLRTTGIPGGTPVWRLHSRRRRALRSYYICCWCLQIVVGCWLTLA